MTATDAIDGPHTACAKSDGTAKSASLYRMAMSGHLCPFGLKSLPMLERRGYETSDIKLTPREDTDAFMEAHGVETTPQTFIGAVGGLSVFKAACIDERQLTCACVGGGSNVPLGFVSPTETLGMGIWMLTLQVAG